MSFSNGIKNHWLTFRNGSIWRQFRLRHSVVTSYAFRNIEAADLSALCEWKQKLVRVKDVLRHFALFTKLIFLNSRQVCCCKLPGRRRVPRNEEAERPTKKRTIEVPRNQFTAIPFSVGQKVFNKQLELKHQARWVACTGCWESKMSSRVNELLAMSKLRLRAAVGLLTLCVSVLF